MIARRPSQTCAGADHGGHYPNTVVLALVIESASGDSRLNILEGLFFFTKKREPTGESPFQLERYRSEFRKFEHIRSGCRMGFICFNWLNWDD